MNNHLLSVSRTHLKLAMFTFIFIVGISFYLLSIGEDVAVVSGLFVTVAFLPIFLVSRFVDSIVLQMIVGISVFTQIVHVPMFVVRKDNYTDYGWNAVKDFSFTVTEFIQIYSLLAFFLVVVIFYVAIFMKVFRFCQLPPSKIMENVKPHQATARKSLNYLILMTVLILLISNLNLWMFRNGISLTGIDPPSLPFRLVGILHYLTILILPLVLAVLYSKTSRSYVSAIILMPYALLLGATQTSKGAVLIIMLPILYCAIKDRKYVLLGISSVFALTAVQIVVLLRGVVFSVVANKGSAESGDGLISAIGRLLDVGVTNFSFFDVFEMLINRIEGAQSIVLSYQFNVDAVGGVFEAFKWFYYDQWNVVDADTYHMEYIGVALPEGFVDMASSLLAKSLWMTHSQPLYIAIFAINVAFFILLGEWLARSISIKYAAREYFYIVGLVYVLFFYTGSGSTLFLGLLTVLIFIAMMPRFSKKWCSRKLKFLRVKPEAHPSSNS